MTRLPGGTLAAGGTVAAWGRDGRRGSSWKSGATLNYTIRAIMSRTEATRDALSVTSSFDRVRR